MKAQASTLRILVLAVALGAGGSLAMAVPSGGSSNSSSGGSSGGGSGGSKPRVYKDSASELHCLAGQKIKFKTIGGKKKYYCSGQQSSSLDEQDMKLFDQASALAKTGHYEQALDVFAQISDQDDPDVLNMTGYSHRKAGRMDLAVTFYRKALDINPNLVQAREYLGEGYVAVGKIELAKAELSEIMDRCGVSCDQYIDLKKAIDAVEN